MLSTFPLLAVKSGDRLSGQMSITFRLPFALSFAMVPGSPGIVVFVIRAASEFND